MISSPADRDAIAGCTWFGFFAMCIGMFIAILDIQIVASYITETYSWHWLFLINLAPGIVVSLLVPVLMRSGRADWALLRHVDGWSLLLVAVCLASLELVLKEGPPRGWGDLYVLALGF